MAKQQAARKKEPVGPPLTPKELEMAELLAGIEQEQALRIPPGDVLEPETGRVFYSGPKGQITESGFWAWSFPRNASEVRELYCVHPLPLWPVESISATTAEGAIRKHVRVRFGTIDGTVGELTLPLSELRGWSRGNHPLVEAGWAAPANKRLAAVEELLLASMTDLIRSGMVPIREGHERCGWHANLHVRPGSDRYVGQSVSLTSQAGDANVWKKTVTEMMEDSGVCAFVIAAALGSFFRGVVPLPHTTSHILHLTGPRGKGKTVIVGNVAGSIVGTPDKPTYLDSRSTMVGLENRLASSNHGFASVDELDDLLANNGDVGAGVLMFLTNGGGRNKGSKGGGEVIGSTWNTTVLSTGNGSLVELSKAAKKGEPLRSRIFELDVMDPDITGFRQVSKLDGWLHALRTNYGHGYPAAIAAIQGEKQRWVQAYHDYKEELSGNARLQAVMEDDARLREFFVLALLGADLASEIISPIAGQAAQEALQTALQQKEGDPDDVLTSSVQSALGTVLSLHEWVAMNANGFMWRGYAYTPAPAGGSVLTLEEGQKARAVELERNAPQRMGGALGLIVQPAPMQHETDFEGELILSARGLEEAEKNGKIDRGELVQALRLFGFLQSSEPGRDTSKLGANLATKLGGTRGLKLFFRAPSEVDLARLQGQGRAPTRDLFPFAPAGVVDGDHVASDAEAEALEREAQQWRDNAPGFEPPEDEPLHIPGFDD